jgi:hypothetical protein
MEKAVADDPRDYTLTYQEHRAACEALALGINLAGLEIGSFGTMSEPLGQVKRRLRKSGPTGPHDETFRLSGNRHS